MKMSELLTIIGSDPDCLVWPPNRMPVIDDSRHHLPNDLTEFYQQCGGVELFRSAEYPYQVLPPNRFLPANQVLVPDQWTDPQWSEDITSDWYLLASDPERQYLTIDLNPRRLGRCYDSFFGRHGVKGFCPVIARSFAELLENLWLNKGQFPYWLAEGFSLGDAYDS